MDCKYYCGSRLFNNVRHTLVFSSTWIFKVAVSLSSLNLFYILADYESLVSLQPLHRIKCIYTFLYVYIPIFFTKLLSIYKVLYYEYCLPRHWAIQICYVQVYNINCKDIKPLAHRRWTSYLINYVFNDILLFNYYL